MVLLLDLRAILEDKKRIRDIEMMKKDKKAKKRERKK